MQAASSLIKRNVCFSKDIGNVVINGPLDIPDSAGSSDLPEFKLQLAATLVCDAKNGQHSDFITNEKCLQLYCLYHHWGLRYLLLFCIFLNHIVAIFEDPAVEGLSLSYKVTMSIEFICMVFYIFRLCHCASFLPPDIFCRDKKHMAVVAAVLLTFIDMSCFIGIKYSGYPDYSYRPSRLLRPIFMINFSENKQVRRAFRNIRKTLPDVLYVLILFFLSIAVFSLMALKLFQKKSLKFPDGRPYFVNYLDIYFQLYVLVTTANNPDIMMPAYDMNRWYALFFIAYLIICLYIFMNVFLAVIYHNYRENLKNEYKNLVTMKRISLTRAFDLLKVRDDRGRYVLDFKRFEDLLKKIPPARSQKMIYLFWYLLDSDVDNKIDKDDFLKLADLLNITASEDEDRRSVFNRIAPNCYNSTLSAILHKAVTHKYFRYFFDLMIFLNAFFIGFDISAAEWFFLTLFSLEIILKIYTFSLTYFFERIWNIFDVFVIGGAVLGSIVEGIMGSDVADNARILDILLVLRVLRLVKILGGIPQFRKIISTIMNLGSSILTYGGVLLVVYYVFAIVGMEIFKNKITYSGYENVTKSNLYCGNAVLNGTTFYQSQYCSNNFNNILHSFVVLFELMVVNQWHIIANGFVLVTSKVARLYFFAFHLTCVIIVLNIFTAFVLEVFILEYSNNRNSNEELEKKIKEMHLELGRKHKHSDTQDTDENKFIIDSEDIEFSEEIQEENNSASTIPEWIKNSGIRFHISKRKNFDNLLERMFKNEVDVTDTDPSAVQYWNNNESSPLLRNYFWCCI